MVPSQEFELKFSLTAEALAALLKKLGVEQALWQRQISVYYDTPENKLFKEGIVLRVRSKGDRFIQTVKAGGPSTLIRQELEKEIPDKNLVLTEGGTPAEKKVWDLRGELQPIFCVDVERLSLPVANLQIDIDKGRIEKAGQSAPVCEVEFELKSGRMAEAVPQIRETLTSIAAELSFFTKSERGFALGGASGHQAYSAEGLAFEKDISAADGFQAIVLSCLAHFSNNKAAVQHGEAAGVHQMRVGLRRLRAALSIFEDALLPAPSKAIAKELKWLTGELGPARDFEVLLSDKALRAAFDDEAQRDKFVSYIERCKLDGLARAKAAVESERYRLLLLETVLWIVGDAFSEKRGDADLRSFARKEMSRRLRKIVKKLKQIDDLDDIARHRARIGVKKLRYGVEFFQSLFGHEPRRSDFLSALKSLQDGLGRLHDFAVHKTILSEIGGPDAGVLAKLIAHEKKETAGLLKAIGKSGEQLAKADTPW